MSVRNCQTRKALAYLGTAASADRNGDIIDMAGYEDAKFIVTAHSVASGAVTSIKVQQGAASNMSDAADLAGTSISIADDDDGEVFVIAITKPKERYLRLVVDKDASNNTDESATVELSGARTLPALENVTDEVTVEVHTSPSEGTA